ncbi:11442_t:CDS:2, partial [Racocetra fulgida]
ALNFTLLNAVPSFCPELKRCPSFCPEPKRCSSFCPDRYFVNAGPPLFINIPFWYYIAASITSVLQYWLENIRIISNKFAEEQAHTEPAVTVEIDVCNSLQANKQTNEVAVQVSNETHEIGVQVSDNMLHTLEARINLLQLQLNLKINEVEDLKKQLEYAYDYVIESWDH